MCLNPIKIYNRSKYWSGYGDPLIMYVPCGHCAECQKAKQNEYTLRSWYEMQDCLNHGGYAYFDTLTYSPKYLPIYRYSINGKPKYICHFKSSDIQRFMKKVRRHLDKDGIDVKNNLKYFIASEYGDDKHRPHYHILFYVKDPRLTVTHLKQVINEAWSTPIIGSDGKYIYQKNGKPLIEPLGITDSVATCRDRVVNSTAALSYVSKYVNKDQEYQEVVNGLKQEIKHCGTLKDKEFIINNARDLTNKHWQSIGYGSSLLDDTDQLMQWCDTNKIIIEDQQHIIKKYDLPQYYINKLFYTNKVNADGSISRVLNDDGVIFKENRLQNVLDGLKNRYETIIRNISNYTTEPKLALDYINYLLDGQTLDNFVNYLVRLRNRVVFNSKSTDLYDLYTLNLTKEKDKRFDLYSDKDLRDTLDNFAFRYEPYEQLYSYFVSLTQKTNDLKQDCQNEKNRLSLIFKQLS